MTLTARALVQQPTITVMDDPAASMDFGNQPMVLQKIHQLAGQDMAAVLSTHDPDQAFQCATAVCCK